jgi:hypothetical protein
MTEVTEHFSLSVTPQTIPIVGEVLYSTNSEKRLKVPIYQREYSWYQNNEHLRLLEDIRNIENLSRQHFLGTLVIHEEGINEVIVDGQQRILTLSMLLWSIKSLANKYIEAPEHEYFVNIDSDDQTNKAAAEELLGYRSDYKAINGYLFMDEENLRVHASQKDMTRYRDILMRPDVLDINDKEPHIIIQRIPWHFTKALVKTELKEKKGIVKLKSLFHHMREHLRVVKFTLSSDAQAYELFETLNSTGASLKQTDLLKNRIISRARDPERLEFAASWDKWINDLMVSEKYVIDPVKVVRCQWIYKNEKIITERYLYSEIRDGIASPSEASNFLTSMVRSAGHLAEWFKKDKYPTNIDDISDLDIAYQELTRHQYKGILPFLLFVRLEKEDWFDELFKTSIRFVLRNVTVGGNHITPSHIESYFTSLISKVKLADSVTDAIGIIKEGSDDVTPITDKVLIQNLMRNSNVSNSLARYVYQKHYEITEPPGGTVLSSKLTCEHIMPQSESDREENWNHVGGHDYGIYKSHIGNMGLLMPRENAAASDSDFATKNDVYKKSKVPSTKCIADHLNNDGLWTVQSIRDRAKSIIGTLAKKKAWDIQLLAVDIDKILDALDS